MDMKIVGEEEGIVEVVQSIGRDNDFVFVFTNVRSSWRRLFLNRLQFNLDLR